MKRGEEEKGKAADEGERIKERKRREQQGERSEVMASTCQRLRASVSMNEASHGRRLTLLDTNTESRLRDTTPQINQQLSQPIKRKYYSEASSYSS